MKTLRLSEIPNLAPLHSFHIKQSGLCQTTAVLPWERRAGGVHRAMEDAKGDFFWQHFYLSVFLSIFLFGSLSIFFLNLVFVYLCHGLSVCLSLYPFVFFPVSLWIYIYLSTYQSISQSTCLSVCLYIHLSFFLFLTVFLFLPILIPFSSVFIMASYIYYEKEIHILSVSLFKNIKHTHVYMCKSVCVFLLLTQTKFDTSYRNMMSHKFKTRITNAQEKKKKNLHLPLLPCPLPLPLPPPDPHLDR